MVEPPEEAAGRLIETIRAGIIGADEAFDGPFGRRRLTYADYTASGRCLRFIEEYITEEVLPRYANTHSETSHTGRQMTRLREEARAVIGRCVGAGPEDAVLFCGSGATGAINKLIAILGLRLPDALERTYALSSRIPPDERPVVFIGPYEHHSNELPWKESICDVVVIPEDSDGGIDSRYLERALQRFRDRPLRIGSFSAASNVTGIISDVEGISALLHEYGALAFWDYAAAAPYLPIRMNAGAAAKDALFLSPHKLLGGPGSPGVLVVKRALCRNRVPSEPGGGTVLWVSPDQHAYLERIEHREEGGTPDIIGAIRAGLAFQLKEAVGAERIRRREDAFVRRCIDRWSRHPNLLVLGNRQRERISIVSFLVTHEQQLLHWSYVVSLLNDLFGIQARGGCSCAGPYGHHLLGLDRQTSAALERLVREGYEGIRPGWVRLNFNYFISEREFAFLLDAVEFVAEHGWELLPLYRFDPHTGRWRHRDGYAEPRVRLEDISYEDGYMQVPSHHAHVPESALPGYLEQAHAILRGWRARVPQESAQQLRLEPEFERWRWFPLPQEALARLQESAARAEPTAGAR